MLEIAQDYGFLIEHLEKLLVVLRLMVVLDGLYDSTIEFVLRVLDLVNVPETTFIIKFSDDDPVLEPLLDRGSILLSGWHGTILSVNSLVF